MKTFNKLFYQSLIVIFLIISSCGSNNEKTEKSNENSSELPVAKENPASQIDPAIMQRGLAVYKTHCFACHQMSGEGIKGFYPPIADNITVSGEKNPLIKIILHGMSGEIEVNGEKYNQVMIPHDFLTDEEIADVLTYIRNSFGNQAIEVTADEVKNVRKGK